MRLASHRPSPAHRNPQVLSPNYPLPGRFRLIEKENEFPSILVSVSPSRRPFPRPTSPASFPSVTRNTSEISKFPPLGAPICERQFPASSDPSGFGCSASLARFSGHLELTSFFGEGRKSLQSFFFHGDFTGEDPQRFAVWCPHNSNAIARVYLEDAVVELIWSSGAESDLETSFGLSLNQKRLPFDASDDFSLCVIGGVPNFPRASIPRSLASRLVASVWVIGRLRTIYRRSGQDRIPVRRGLRPPPSAALARRIHRNERSNRDLRARLVIRLGSVP